MGIYALYSTLCHSDRGTHRVEGGSWWRVDPGGGWSLVLYAAHEVDSSHQCPERENELPRVAQAAVVKSSQGSIGSGSVNARIERGSGSL